MIRRNLRDHTSCCCCYCSNCADIGRLPLELKFRWMVWVFLHSAFDRAIGNWLPCGMSPPCDLDLQTRPISPWWILDESREPTPTFSQYLRTLDDRCEKLSMSI